MRLFPIIKRFTRPKRFRQDCERLEKLLDIEINTFLRRIYGRMGSGLKPNPLQVKFTSIKVEISHPTETLPWKFLLNNVEEAKNGYIGIVKVPYYRAAISRIRKQTAVLVAAQLYLLHRYAANFPEKFEKIKNAGGLFGSVLRPVRDIIMISRMEKETCHVLAAVGCMGWLDVRDRTIFLRFRKIGKIDKNIAGELNIAERMFGGIEKEIEGVKKKLSMKDIEKTSIFIDQEIGEIDSIVGLIESDRKLRESAGASGAGMGEHVKRLRSIRGSLAKIRDNIEHWEHLDRHSGMEFRLKLGHMGPEERSKEAKAVLDKQARMFIQDVHVLHLLYGHFEHEKARIINDIRLFKT